MVINPSNKPPEYFKDATFGELADMLKLIPDLGHDELTLVIEWVAGNEGFYPDSDYKGQSGARWFITHIGTR